MPPFDFEENKPKAKNKTTYNSKILLTVLVYASKKTFFLTWFTKKFPTWNSSLFGKPGRAHHIS